MEKEDPQGMRISYQFKDATTLSVVASASDNDNECISLLYGERKYQFYSYPKFIEKPQLNIKYPLSSKRKKTIGFHILDDGKCVAKYYGEAATCRKKGLLKRNIGFTVFEYQQEPYMLYRVGFPKENSHYYCLYNNDGKTIAVIERHSFYSDNCKATIYIEDVKHIHIALFACTEEIIFVANTGNREDIMDPSAGHYVSLLEEEREMFDKNFVEHVKEM